MRILVTGGAGFIGSHLVDRLLKDGHQVIVLDNFVTGKDENFAHHAGNERFEFVRHNVSNYIYVAGELDWVMHFASPASPPDYLDLPIQTLKVNSLGTHNTLGLAMAKRASYFLASTSEVYGDPEQHPQSEDYWGNVNPIGPRGVYDESKRFAEALTMAYHHKHELDTRIVRIFNCYGPRLRVDDGRVVSNFISQALSRKPITIYGDGSQTRSFQYVSDLVDGIVRMMNVKYHMPINLGNPNELKISEIADLITELTDSSSKIVYEPLPVDDPKRRHPDISRAKEVLGWQPRVELRDGLNQTIEWFQGRLATTSS